MTDMLFSVKTLSARLSLIPLYCGLREGVKGYREELFYLRKADAGTQSEQ